jgi:hypothetical protein
MTLKQFKKTLIEIAAGENRVYKNFVKNKLFGPEDRTTYYTRGMMHAYDKIAKSQTLRFGTRKSIMKMLNAEYISAMKLYEGAIRSYGKEHKQVAYERGQVKAFDEMRDYLKFYVPKQKTVKKK